MSVAGPLERRRLATGYAAGNQGFPAPAPTTGWMKPTSQPPILGTRPKSNGFSVTKIRYQATGAVRTISRCAAPFRVDFSVKARAGGTASIRRKPHVVARWRLYVWIVAPYPAVRNLASKCRRLSEDPSSNSGLREDARSARCLPRAEPCWRDNMWVLILVSVAIAHPPHSRFAPAFHSAEFSTRETCESKGCSR